MTTSLYHLRTFLNTGTAIFLGFDLSGVTLFDKLNIEELPPMPGGEMVMCIGVEDLGVLGVFDVGFLGKFSLWVPVKVVF